MIFKTQYDERGPVYQDPGSRVKIVYTPKYDSNGVLDLVATGQEDLYSYIQSHKDSTDIHYLLDRFVNGETDVLSRIQGFYGDFSDMPKTYAEVLNSVIAGEEAFARLPVEVKQRFDNSFAVWLAAMDSPDFSRRMGFVPDESDLTPSQVQDFSSNSGTSSAPSPATSPAAASDSQ
ncbi:internal scaffolding protein [Sigmofec virus UA08Rod_5898]|uniref:Internal scaffolding protein n=1 Tax=Sigmofec virus UA08Rod_5898 TaxID=2929444 RepID=A0A976R8I5_9VIRU|nr:internal scaffolding protein [Sigmofec virus UA08Rod_5898]